MVEGDLAACRAALDAGCAAAMRTGRVISRKEIGRPDDDTQWLVTGFNRQPEATRKGNPTRQLSSRNLLTSCWRC